MVRFSDIPIATPTLADALPLWLRCLLVVSGRCFAAVMLLLWVDTWPPSCPFMVSVSGLGGVVLHEVSHVLGHLVWLGGWSGVFPSLFYGRCFASLLAICVFGLSLVFFLYF